MLEIAASGPGALAVALAFGGVLAVGGAGLAPHLDREARPVALAAVVGLGALVVASTDLAAAAGFRPWIVLALAAAACVAGWLVPSRRGPDRLRPASDRLAPVALGAAALALGAPLLLLPVPLDTDAQGFGHLALAIREGGTLDTLAPWRPDIGYLYAPGALLVFATLSSVAPAVPLSAVMLGASHAAAFFFVWLARDLGAELGHRARGDAATPGRHAPAMLAGAALSPGLWTALLDSHYTAIFALLFALAFLTALLRCLRAGRTADAAVATLALAAVVVSHPDTTMIVGLGIGSLLVAGWLAVDRPGPGRFLAVTAGIPALALVLVSPWIWRLLPLVRAGIESPYEVDPRHWRLLVWYHGGVWPALALLGAALHVRRRPAWALMMAGWLLALVEFSSLGLLERAAPALMGPLLRFDYPFSLAWHGPVLPYLVLGTAAVVWLADRPRAAAGIGIAAILGVVLVVTAWGRSGAGAPRPYGAFASANDVIAMRWLRAHAAPGVRILNYPGDYEGGRDWEAHWAPVITERDSVYFRMQLFFQAAAAGGAGGVERARAEQQAMLAFWRDPADPAHATRLRAARIGYVLVPEAVGDPASLTRAWRWQPPAVLPGARSTPRDAAYLRLVFRAGGAEVHAVSGDGSSALPGRGEGAEPDRG